MKALIIVVGFAIILGLGALWLHATPGAPTMGSLSVLPTSFAINKATIVTVTIPIPDSSLIPNGVNLLQLGASGTQPVILGVMHDDGQNGDAVAGDGIYTFRPTFNEPGTGQVQLQASAAFRGLLKRVLTPIISIAVTADGTKPLPPDPGSAGMTTLAGVDSDGDGVRDDIERYIALTYPQSGRTRAALTQMAVAMQAELLDASTQSLVITDTLQWTYAADCLESVTAISNADVTGLYNTMNIANALKAQILNTPVRTQAYYNANDELGAFTYSQPSFSTLATYCAVSPSSLPN